MGTSGRRTTTFANQLRSIDCFDDENTLQGLQKADTEQYKKRTRIAGL